MLVFSLLHPPLRWEQLLIDELNKHLILPPDSSEAYSHVIIAFKNTSLKLFWCVRVAAALLVTPAACAKTELKATAQNCKAPKWANDPQLLLGVWPRCTHAERSPGAVLPPYMPCCRRDIFCFLLRQMFLHCVAFALWLTFIRCGCFPAKHYPILTRYERLQAGVERIDGTAYVWL